uniref:Uncharacterized protein n=1 Tax=Oryza punctata TaxID=4537 RepID=A0A0E0JUJ7_ORYPU
MESGGRDLQVFDAGEEKAVFVVGTGVEEVADGDGDGTIIVGRYCEAKNSAPDNSDQWQHRVPTAKPNQVFI